MRSTAPSLSLVEERSGGALLAEERRRRGITLEQVASATRIRLHHLAAIESGALTALPGAVYARGYARAYAEYLGLDPEPVLAALAPPAAAPSAGARRALSLGPVTPPPPVGLVLTRPAVAAAGLLLLGLLFSLYAGREIESARTEPALPAPNAPVEPPRLASPPPLPAAEASAEPTPVVHPILVAIKATETVWVAVSVDGQPVLGPGRFLQPGEELTFVGRRIRVSSGKPSLMVSLSGGEYEKLGGSSREFSAQT